MEKNYPPLIQSLKKSEFFPHNVSELQVIETHISWVILTGEYAYKIKKPVDLGFLDFSTLDKRKYFCEEEIRLNKRLAPEYYLDVVKISGSELNPVYNGDGEAIEYAVRMRQFPQQCELDQLLAINQLDNVTMALLAEKIAEFHSNINVSSASSDFGDYGVQVGGNAYEPVGGLSTEHAETYYPDNEKVPDKSFFYVPVQCQQCEKPPCVKACPVRATYRDPNGVVVIDYNWCIGCRMCQLACPYQARRFNWGEPNLPAEEMNPKTHYFGNRPRMKGVMEKCTFCIQRTREGRNPACLEACPVGARKFGNLLDPDSDVRKILATKKVFRFRSEMSTYPKFFYYIG